MGLCSSLKHSKHYHRDRRKVPTSEFQGKFQNPNPKFIENRKFHIQAFRLNRQKPKCILFVRVSDIQGRIKTAEALKPGEGESSQAATANVLRNKP